MREDRKVFDVGHVKFEVFVGIARWKCPQAVRCRSVLQGSENADIVLIEIDPKRHLKL